VASPPPPAAPSPPAPSPTSPTPTAPALDTGSRDAGDAVAVPGMGAQRFSHSGQRHVLGYGEGFFGIWDRSVVGGPVLSFPRTDEGWHQAWHRFLAMEPQAVEVG